MVIQFFPFEVITMIFNSIHIQNFLSIQNITLPLNNCGLVLLNGKNLDNSSLNNNGAGKSSILEAIVFALYGRTLRGLKGDAVIHRLAGNNMHVILNITDDDGTPYQIARYRKHVTNKSKSLLYRCGVDITPKSEADFDRYIANLLQADYSTFTASLLYSAESFKFSTATDSEIKKTFDTMLGLDVLSKALELTRSQLKDTVKELTKLRNDKSECEHQLVKLSDKEQQLQFLQQKFDSDKKVKMRQLDESITVLQDKSQLLKDEHNSLQHQVVEAKDKLESAIKQLDVKNDELQQLDELKDELRKLESEHDELVLKKSTYKKSIIANDHEIERLQKSINAAQIKIDKLEKKKQDLIQTIGQPCPTCGSPLTAEKIESAQQQYNDDIQEIQDDIANIQISIKTTQEDTDSQHKQIEKLDKQIEELLGTKQSLQHTLKACKLLESSRDELVKQVDQLKERYYHLQAQLQMKKMEITQNDDLINQTQKNLKDSREAKNPYDELVMDVQLNILSTKEKVGHLIIDIDVKSQLEECLKFWEMAYSNQGIKSLILDDITPFLNRRVNRYLTKLAAGQIEAIFSTRTALKSGGESERFSLTITNQDGGEQYSSNSSGEKKRIDLAINLALQDLVASRSSKKINIAIFDEVFDALDENGIDSVISLLQELSQEKSTILVVTHNEHLKSYFNNCITIVKKNGFSYIEGDQNDS